MKFTTSVVVFCAILSSVVLGVDRFVITEKLPAKKHNEPAVVAGCECGKPGCPREGCSCRKMSVSLNVGETWSKKVVLVFAPDWCVNCGPYLKAVVDDPRITVVHMRTTAPIETGITSYPSLYSPEKRLRIEAEKDGWKDLPTDMRIVADAMGYK